MESDEQQLPRGWVETTLAAVCQILDYKRIPVNERERSRRTKGRAKDELYPYYGATGRVGVIDDFLFEGEHVLLGEDGAPFLDPSKPKAYLVRGKFWVNNHAHIIKASVSNEYVCHYLNQLDYSVYVTGTTRLKLTQNALMRLPVHVAPKNEQCRIVAKIEELFSELDKGIESLKTARRQLEVYRQSVLKHAFEGKLTAQWREENKDRLEKPEQLLARVKQGRVTRYDRQLKRWKMAVKEWEDAGKTSTRPPKPKVPAEVTDTPGGIAAKLPELPEGWLWLRLDSIADIVGGITKNQTRSRLPHKMKYLRVANVYADKISTDNVHEIGVTEAEARKVALEVGDLLVVEGNGSMDQIGRVAMWNGELPVCGHQNHLIRVRLANGFEPRFVLQFLLSPQGRDLIVKEASSTSGLHTLSISKVSNLFVPVASPSEEVTIVAEIDEKLARIDRALEEVDIQLAKSEALRQAILKKAFSGQLVAHDPNDETASVLLNRIREEKRQASKRDRARPHGHEAKATS